VHGVIFASFVDYVATRHGSEVAGEILSDQPVILLSESYEDERLLALVARASEVIVRRVSSSTKSGSSRLSRRSPASIRPSSQLPGARGRSSSRWRRSSTSSCERRSQMPARRNFKFGRSGTTASRITYTSPRRLCALLAGLVEGTARHYGEEVQIEQTGCMLRDNPACVFQVRVSSGTRAA